MASIIFEGLMCFYSTTGSAGTRDEVVVVIDDPDHVRSVTVDGVDYGYNFKTLSFGVTAAATIDNTFRDFVSHLKDVSKSSSTFAPNNGIRIVLPPGNLRVRLLVPHAGEFTLPGGGGKVTHFIAYKSQLNYTGSLNVTIDGTTHTITRNAVIRNLSGSASSRSAGDPCFNHFARYGKLLASGDCSDVASVEDLGGAASIVAEAVETERGTIVMTSVLQTQCSNSQWP
jgi:hypothetical protein